MGLSIHRILRKPIDFFWWCVEYDGSGAIALKSIAVLILAAIIAEPLLYLLICLIVAPLIPSLQYLLYVGLWMHFLPFVALAWQEYMPKS